MTIQKKSLLSSLNTTKKAIVASNSAEEKPNVAAPVAARVGARLTARVGARLAARVAGKVIGRVRNN